MAKAVLKACGVVFGCFVAGTAPAYVCLNALDESTHNEGFIFPAQMVLGGFALLGLVVGLVWAARIIDGAR